MTIIVTFTDGHRARAEFTGETAHRVAYRGTYHAVFDDGAWVGSHRTDVSYKPYYFPVCQQDAMSAYRMEGFMVDATRAAREVLAKRCLDTIIAHAAANPAELRAAELVRLEQAAEQAAEKAKETLAEYKRLHCASVNARKALNAFRQEVA